MNRLLTQCIDACFAHQGVDTGYTLANRHDDLLYLGIKKRNGENTPLLYIPKGPNFYVFPTYSILNTSYADVAMDIVHEWDRVRGMPMSLVTESAQHHEHAIHGFTLIDGCAWRDVFERRRFLRLIKSSSHQYTEKVHDEERADHLKMMLAAYRRSILDCKTRYPTFYYRWKADPIRVNQVQYYYAGIEATLALMVENGVLSVIDSRNDTHTVLETVEDATTFFPSFLETLHLERRTRELFSPSRFHFNRRMRKVPIRHHETIYQALSAHYSGEEIEEQCAQAEQVFVFQVPDREELSYGSLLGLWFTFNRNGRIETGFGEDGFIQTVNKLIKKDDDHE